ncbi:hypothetical protein CEXT_143401 [Caerostris extrusa]|uniref:Ycf15 n=1 Tax=Caerostris extrusa TaxID=172846 RepID=A0AAV4S8C0_CAEEX|nr:hypothetical protein CEXT_143401 [Caerostris extrusa]
MGQRRKNSNTKMWVNIKGMHTWQVLSSSSIGRNPDFLGLNSQEQESAPQHPAPPHHFSLSDTHLRCIRALHFIRK